jgi:hypothetical protein
VVGVNQLPPGYVTQQNDAEHLKLLSVFHYVLGGLSALFAFFPLIYVVMGVVFLNVPATMGSGSAAPLGPSDPNPAGMIGGMFIFIGILGTLVLVGYATIQFLAARWISQRRRWTFCFVVACIECISVPLGTVLGVFTILVLNRPSVRAVFR